MINRPSKFNIFLSTLNFVLVFVGAQFVYSIFLPIQSNADIIVSAVTVPYRYFAMLVSLLVVVMNIGQRTRMSGAVRVFIFFWVLFLIRMFFDLEVSLHSFTREQVFKQWQSTLGMVVILFTSILLSYEKIDIKRAFLVIYSVLILVLGLSFFASESSIDESSSQRMDMNAALGSLQLGLSASTCLLLSVKFFIDNKKLGKAFALVIILMSIMVLLRTGSRGPLVSTVVVLLFFLFSRMKQVIVGFIILGLSVSLLFVFQDNVMQKIEEISPLMYRRLDKTINEGDMSGRELIYDEAFEVFSDSPIIGKQFYLAKGYGAGFRYAHNIFLDSLIALGIIGGILMTYLIFKSISINYYMIKNRDPAFWLCLILLLNIMFAMTSGAFYNNQSLNVLITYLFAYHYNKSLKTSRL